MTEANDAPQPQSESHDDLSARQRAFCAEYLVDKNGTQAAIRAGYSAASAKQQASRLLEHPKIKANITAALDQLALDAGVKAADVVARLKQIAWSQPSETWRGSDIMKAIELLGKHLGMWADERGSKDPTFEELVLAADAIARQRQTPALLPAAADPPAASVEIELPREAVSPEAPAGEVEAGPPRSPYRQPRGTTSAAAPSECETAFDPFESMRRN